MVRTAKPTSTPLYNRQDTQREERKGKERKKNPPSSTGPFHFATAINTVFTDEVMQFVWRGQHQGGGRGPPGVWVSEGWSAGTEGAAARGTNVVKMKPCLIILQSTLREFWCCSYTRRQESRKSGDVSLLLTVGGRGGSVVKGAVQTGQVIRCPCSGWALGSGAGPPSELSACARHRKINASSLHEFHMHKSC